MAKKLGKFLLLTAAAGSAAAAAYYFLQKKAASQTASEDEDYDDFITEDEEPENTHSYVPLTPDTKNSDDKETADHTADTTADAASEQEPMKQDSGEQDSGFTPLFQQLSDAEEETVEEFFNEDTEAPEKAE